MPGGNAMCHEIPFYLAGYYLMKLKPINFGSQASKRVFTTSDFINDSLLDYWSYSWTTKNNEGIGKIKEELQVDDEKIQAIRSWVDRAFEEKRIGWPNIFFELETVREYSQTFFPHLIEKRISGIYLSESESIDFLSEFDPKKVDYGSIGLFDGLQKRTPESDSNFEIFIGFDLIGIECSGNYHTFYCHDISKDLAERFGLTINEYGLFEGAEDWKPIMDYMNDEKNGFEPVPWFVCKTKLVNEDDS